MYYVNQLTAKLIKPFKGRRPALWQNLINDIIAIRFYQVSFLFSYFRRLLKLDEITRAFPRDLFWPRTGLGLAKGIPYPHCVYGCFFFGLPSAMNKMVYFYESSYYSMFKFCKYYVICYC